MKPDSKLPDLSNYKFGETPFRELMQKRVGKVLIICSNYDFYMLEEDGRIDEIIFNEYVGLNLRYPPAFIQANSPRRAKQTLATEKIDLVIVWLTAGSTASFDLAHDIRAGYPEVPIVALTHYSSELARLIDTHGKGAIDRIFHWNGDANIFLAIIKLVEDQMNFEFDVVQNGVQAILLVEDSIRYYSSYLPTIYKLVFRQSLAFKREALNEHRRMLQMRGRPKIILATNYDEAIQFYETQKHNLLGVISDISYPRGGQKDEIAGLRLAQKIKEESRYFPVLLQSSRLSNERQAKDLRVGFLYKHSPTLSIELRDFINQYFAFGDFEFKDPRSKQTIAVASDLKSLQRQLREVPDDSLRYHVYRDHFSKWLKARALFPLAELFFRIKAEEFDDIPQVREFLHEAIALYRHTEARGVIAKFDRDRYDEYLTFTRIGDGALGGKGRGLAFIDSFLKRHKLAEKYDGITVSIPRTVVLSTSVYDEFMERHQLLPILTGEMTDEEVLQTVVSKRLPEWVYLDLRKFIASARTPIAIRSSSVLEDSHYQPFAGIFSTYMIPNLPNKPEQTLDMLVQAIKSVYASVFYKSSKAYVRATAHSVEEGKMAVTLQEVTGAAHGNLYFPSVSGVARSINFYPIGDEKASEGIAHIGFGLGRITVGGGRTLRVSPAHPNKVLQLSSADMALRDTQKHFYALDLDPAKFSISTDDDVNLLKLKITEAPPQSLAPVASTYDLQNNVIRPGIHYQGRKVITFDNILKYNTVPIPQIIADLLRIGQREMSFPVEIEFAANLSPAPGQPKVFSFLQIRPIVENNLICDVVPENIAPTETIVYSESALGNGRVDSLRDIIYVKPETFDAAHSREIAQSVERINLQFEQAGQKYILIGPGRWGSSDPWLGIPVVWTQISAAKIIIEAGQKNYRIDPSQGTHFFQNLTSFNVGYFTINPYIGEGAYDLDFLASSAAVYEDSFVRHLRFEQPLIVKIDGKRNRGVIFKPGFGENRPVETSEAAPPEGFC